MNNCDLPLLAAGLAQRVKRHISTNAPPLPHRLPRPLRPSPVILRPAVRRALVRTGRIISSCGLITAVSLGTLLLSGEGYLIQMGFALAVGTLLDSFIIRPLLLPALLLLLKRPRVNISAALPGREAPVVPA